MLSSFRIALEQRLGSVAAAEQREAADMTRIFGDWMRWCSRKEELRFVCCLLLRD